MNVPLFSFEIVPPTADKEAELPNKVRELRAMGAVSFDVTYGAGGKNVGDPRAATLKTVDVVCEVAPDTPLIVHLPAKRFFTSEPLEDSAFTPENEENIPFTPGSVEDFVFNELMKKRRVGKVMVMTGDGQHLYPDNGYLKVEDMILGLSLARSKMGAAINKLEMLVVVDPSAPDAMPRLVGKKNAIPESAREYVVMDTAYQQYVYDGSEALGLIAPARKEKIAVVPGLMFFHGMRPNKRDRYGIPVSERALRRYAIANGMPDREAAIARVGMNLTTEIAQDLRLAKRIQIFDAVSNIEAFKALRREVWPTPPAAHTELQIPRPPGGWCIEDRRAQGPSL